MAFSLCAINVQESWMGQETIPGHQKSPFKFPLSSRLSVYNFRLCYLNLLVLGNKFPKARYLIMYATLQGQNLII